MKRRRRRRSGGRGGGEEEEDQEGKGEHVQQLVDLFGYYHRLRTICMWVTTHYPIIQKIMCLPYSVQIQVRIIMELCPRQKILV